MCCWLLHPPPAAASASPSPHPHHQTQLLFTTELNRRLAAAAIPVDALALHPGNVMTEVVRTLPPLIQRLYRALLTHVLFTPQEGG